MDSGPSLARPCPQEGQPSPGCTQGAPLFSEQSALQGGASSHLLGWEGSWRVFCESAQSWIWRGAGFGSVGLVMVAAAAAAAAAAASCLRRWDLAPFVQTRCFPRGGEKGTPTPRSLARQPISFHCL